MGAAELPVRVSAAGLAEGDTLRHNQLPGQKLKQQHAKGKHIDLLSGPAAAAPTQPS
jgi:hypothetical protein